MGIAGFVATQEIGQLAQLAQTDPGISGALKKGTMDREMSKIILAQLRTAEAQQLPQGPAQVETFVDTMWIRTSKLKS